MMFSERGTVRKGRHLNMLCRFLNWRTAFLPEIQRNRRLICTFWQRLFKIILQNYRGETRDVFIGRYFFSDSVREVAGYYGMSESKAKSMLYRTRIGLKKYLEQEGFFDEA